MPNWQWSITARRGAPFQCERAPRDNFAGIASLAAPLLAPRGRPSDTSTKSMRLQK
ncbi:hypothetical protein PUN4_560084 [Paraburkholderia unamae]|nr:hypothetical protein PUN4_560084 [Paraburkholderia unamae]